jgi:hypothetical protein
MGGDLLQPLRLMYTKGGAFPLVKRVERPTQQKIATKCLNSANSCSGKVTLMCVACVLVVDDMALPSSFE